MPFRVRGAGRGEKSFAHTSTAPSALHHQHCTITTSVAPLHLQHCTITSPPLHLQWTITSPRNRHIPPTPPRHCTLHHHHLQHCTITSPRGRHIPRTPPALHHHVTSTAPSPITRQPATATYHPLLLPFESPPHGTPSRNGSEWPPHGTPSRNGPSHDRFRFSLDAFAAEQISSRVFVRRPSSPKGTVPCSTRRVRVILFRNFAVLLRPDGERGDGLVLGAWRRGGVRNILFSLRADTPNRRFCPKNKGKWLTHKFRAK